MTDRKSSDGRRGPLRRQFLKVGAVAGVGALTGLSGCLGGDDSTPDEGGDTATRTPEDRGDPDVREEYGLPELSYPLEDQVNVFQWADYWPLSEDFNTIQVFEDAYGVEVNVSNYASNEEMFNKFQAGGTDQFDVAFPSDYMVNIMAEQDMLQPLDLEKLTHWENLEDKWRNEAPSSAARRGRTAPRCATCPRGSPSG